jgi:hypothetical protein
MTATGAPGVLFSRGATDNVGDALGFNGNINGFSNNAFTAFVVGDFNSTVSGTQPQRAFQIGAIGGNNLKIVGFANDGFRFNGNSKLFTQDMETGGAHIATYSMTMGSTAPIGAAGTNAIYRYDGGATTFKSSGPGPSTDTISFANDGFALGAGQNNSSTTIDSLNGILYAVLLYNKVLSDTEITQVETFLTNKFITPAAVPEAGAWLLLTAVGACVGLVGSRRAARHWKPV